MARPVIPTIASGTAGWDAVLNDIILALTQRPLPIHRIADVATLETEFPAPQYEDCIILVLSPSKALYVSDGTDWNALT